MMQNVVTYQDTRGNQIDICQRHQAELEAAGQWPKNPATGEEYCTVSHGLHRGTCELCEAQ